LKPRKNKKPEKKRPRSEPTGIGDILSSLKRETALGEQLEIARIWDEWPALAGKLAYHGKPVTVKDGTLYIEADSTVWMHKFAYRKWGLMMRINKLAQRELVSDIFIKLAPDAPESEGPGEG
jgi:predicted nucleic acid-binding Zn ribbon protein